MKNFMKMVLMVAVLTVAGTLSASDGWLTNFNKARAEAAKRNLPILLDFSGSDWCGWCKKLDKEVFSTKAFKEYAKKNFVLLLADIPHAKPMPKEVLEQNNMLQHMYGVRGFPTVLILDKDGKVLARTGYKAGGAKAYIAHLEELKKQIAALK